MLKTMLFRLFRIRKQGMESSVVLTFPTSLSGDNSEWEPPESIPNSEVKPFSADDSVGDPM